MNTRARIVSVGCSAILVFLLAAAYATAAAPAPLLATWSDPARKREVPIKAYLPEAVAPAPVILFSHGLGGSRQHYEYLGKYWAERGYLALHIQHVGSDDSVWRNAKNSRAMALMAAASVTNYLLRVQDVSFTIDELTRLNADKTSPLFGRADLERIGIAGHSFGALTVQAEAGQAVLDAGVQRVLRDSRIKAAVAMSPSPPPAAHRAVAAFKNMATPIFYLTGTADFDMFTLAGVNQRRKPFDEGAGSDQYLAIFDGGDHMLFTGRRRGNDKPKDSDVAAWTFIQKSTTAFFDAYLRDDVGQRAWMQEKAAAEMRTLGKLETKAAPPPQS